MIDIDYQSFRMVFDLVQAVIIVVLAVYTWFSNRNKATYSAIDRVDARVTEVVGRTNTLETRLSLMPSDKHIQDIHEKINRVVTAQAESSGQLQAIVRQLEMINQHLLKGDK